MCGITGIIGENIEKGDKTNIKNMLDFLLHRGPNSNGIFEGNNFIFGNSRLSVMDLEKTGNLPFIYNLGEIVLAYNGEITNYLYLKKKYSLDEKYNFIGNSDTEVLLFLYKEIGIKKLLEEIDGYFVFSLYDKSVEKIYIVRDFFGTRPVFYTEINKKLYFASEIKSLLQIDNFKKEIDKKAIYHYFGLGYIPGNLTAFKNIKELEGGEFIEYDFKSDNYKIEKYYDIKSKINYKRSFSNTKKELFSIFEESILRNINSDALLGSTLSGGIDTSIIVGMMKYLNKSKGLHTFSIKVNESSFDESKYQRIMSDYAETIHHEIVINSNDIEKNIYEYVSFTDEPYADGAAIPTFLMTKEAKKYVKVLLSGEGGDENFSAYETHQAYLVRKFYNKYIPNFIRNQILKGTQKMGTNFDKLSFDFKAKRFSLGAKYDIPESHYYWRHILSDNEQDILFGENNYDDTSKFFSDIFNSLDFEEDLSKLAYIDFKMFLIGDLMIKNDRMTMANSIETRYPFLEKQITDFSFSIPEKYKINLFNRRIIEKETFKNILPKEIYKRPNFGMEIPYSKWFTKDLKGLLDKYVKREKIEEIGFFNYDFVAKKYSEHMLRKQDNGRFLWAFLNFMIWFELFIKTDNYKKYVKK